MKITSETFSKEKLMSFFKVNKKVVLIKICFFLSNFSICIAFPFLTLQMWDLGLSFSDISIITGFVPFITFAFSPILGFIGDRIGYKSVLIFCILSAGVSVTSFLFVPPYREHTQSPYAILVSQKDSDAFQLREVYWPLCGGQAVTEEACEESEPFSSEEFANISLHFECTLPPGFSFPQEDFQFDIVNVTELTNGTFCHAGSSSSSPPSDLFNLAVRCFVNEDYLETCVSVEGSHAKTFWIYFAFDCLYILGMNSMFALLDGTALHLTSQHGSHYSYVMMWNILGAACAPLVSGFAIQEPEPGEPTDYRLAFYIADVFIVIHAVCVLFLDIKVDKTGEKVSESLKQFLTVPTLLFFSMISVVGLAWGASSYLGIYLQEELNAPPIIFSVMVNVSSVASFLMNFFAKRINNFVGDFNMIYIGLVVSGIRLLIYSLVVQSPPWYAVGLSLFDVICWCLAWNATVKYGYTIAPLDLVATMSTSIATIQWVVAKGIGSLIAGQLLGNTSLEIPGLFQYTAGLSCAAGLVLWICYQVFGKRYEKVIVENKQALVARLKEEKGGTKEPSKATLSVPGGEGQKEEDGDSIASMMKVTGSWGGRSMVSTKF